MQSGPRPPVEPGAGEVASGPIAERTEAKRHPVIRCGPHTPRAAERSEHAGQYLLLCLRVAVLVFVEVPLPRLGIPDLQPGDRADDHALLGQARVATQLRGDGDPSLAVRSLLVGTGEQV